MIVENLVRDVSRVPYHCVALLVLVMVTRLWLIAYGRRTDE